MRACSKCGVVKALGEFSPDARAADGRQRSCKACGAAARKARRLANPDKLRAQAAASRARHADRINAKRRERYRSDPEAAQRQRAARVGYIAAYNAAYYAKNRERELTRKAAYRNANLETIRAKGRAKKAADPAANAAATARYRARCIRATPSWANLELVAAYYTMAAWMTQATGIPHHVDHVEPLRGRHVCGLHNEFNLQVLPAEVNIAKGNRPSDARGIR